MPSRQADICEGLTINIIWREGGTCEKARERLDANVLIGFILSLSAAFSSFTKYSCRIMKTIPSLYLQVSETPTLICSESK